MGQSGVSNQLAVTIWAEMVGLGKPTKDSPTVKQIQGALTRALRGVEAGAPIADALAEALRPFVFDWDQAISEQEDWIEEDHANPELGNVVDRATMERACGALERYERERRV